MICYTVVTLVGLVTEVGAAHFFIYRDLPAGAKKTDRTYQVLSEYDGFRGGSGDVAPGIVQFRRGFRLAGRRVLFQNIRHGEQAVFPPAFQNSVTIFPV